MQIFSIQMKKPFHLLSVLGLAVISLLAISQARAGQIWDGGGGDTNWNTAANCGHRDQGGIRRHAHSHPLAR